MPSVGLSIDHVVLAVSDLPTAEADFRELGFVLKPGHRHDNGLRNAHIKFPDGSALELMAIEGTAFDDVAEGYEEFLRGGDGAAFVAIEGDLPRIAAAATDVGLSWEISSTGSYSWLTLADSTPVFFIQWDRRPVDPDSMTVQVDGVSGISSVRLASTPGFGRLLATLGVPPCPTGDRPEIGVAERLARSGDQRIRITLESDARFRVQQVTLHGSGRTGVRQLDPDRTHGVRIRIAE